MKAKARISNVKIVHKPPTEKIPHGRDFVEFKVEIRVMELDEAAEKFAVLREYCDELDAVAVQVEINQSDLSL